MKFTSYFWKSPKSTTENIKKIDIDEQEFIKSIDQQNKQMQILNSNSSNFLVLENENKLKEEELEELTKLLQDLNTLKLINQDLITIVGEQKHNIQIIEEDIIKTNDIINISNIELLEADTLQIENTGTKLTVMTVGTTIVGAVAISVAGVKIGLILGVVALFSGTVWTIWPKKNNKT